MMDVATQNQVLREVADGGAMNYDVWPELLPCVIERIEIISRTRFRIPKLPPPRPSYQPAAAAVIPNSQPDPATEAQPENKENTVPDSSSGTTISGSPIHGPTTAGAPASSETQGHPSSSSPSSSGGGGGGGRNSMAAATDAVGVGQASSSTMDGHGGDVYSTPPPPDADADGDGQQRHLPPQIASMLSEVTQTLSAGFPEYPPHTMQRLAELVIEPTRHYKHLVPYLHALDRVVHVTSGANVYPLPPAVPDMSALQFLSLGTAATPPLPNGGGVDAPGGGAGSSTNSSAAVTTAVLAGIHWGNPTSTAPTDESQLGGALLTPIPWLARQAEEAAEAAAAAAAAAAGTTSVGASPPAPGGTSPGSQSSGGGGEFRTESTETIDGPNGMGSIETVSINLNGILPGAGAPPVMPAGVMVGASTTPGAVGSVAGGASSSRAGVTQGELLRQEQKAGVVPKTQLDNPTIAASASTSGGGDEMDTDIVSADGSSSTTAKDTEGVEKPNTTAATGTVDQKQTTRKPEDDADEEIPHARGPEEIGDTDLGPQKAGMVGVEMHGIDVEAAVGRKAFTHPQAHHHASSAHSHSRPTHSISSGGSGGKAAARAGGEDEDSDDDAASRALSPKREAEDELDGLAAKRARTERGDDKQGVKDMDVDVPAAEKGVDKSEPLARSGGKEKDEEKMDVDKPEKPTADATATKTETKAGEDDNAP